MKKLLFVFIMASLVLAACGGGTPAATDAPASNEPDCDPCVGTSGARVQ